MTVGATLAVHGTSATKSEVRTGLAKGKANLRDSVELPYLRVANVQDGNINLLDATEIAELNRIASMFLDYAEDRASQRQNLRMGDWRQYVDRFVEFNERPLLKTAGSISHERMQQIAHERYAEFDAKRRPAEALAADAEDIKELEAVEKRGRKGGEDAS